MRIGTRYIPARARLGPIRALGQGLGELAEGVELAGHMGEPDGGGLDPSRRVGRSCKSAKGGQDQVGWPGASVLDMPA